MLRYVSRSTAEDSFTKKGPICCSELPSQTMLRHAIFSSLIQLGKHLTSICSTRKGSTWVGTEIGRTSFGPFLLSQVAHLKFEAALIAASLADACFSIRIMSSREACPRFT